MAANDRLLTSFTRSLRSMNRSPRTIEGYLASARMLAEFHDSADLAAMTRADVEKFIVHLLETRSASTAATRFRCLQQLFKWMATEEIVDRNPMAGMVPPAIPDKAVPVVSDDEIRALLKACEGKDFTSRRDTAVIRLFLEPGGLRLSELAGLTLADVDLEQDAVYAMGKGRRPRVVPYGVRTGQAIDRYLRAREAHPLAYLPALWLGSKGKPLTNSGVAQMLQRRQEAAGLGHLHPHMLRHTAAHAWLAAGGSETDAMRLFGWRSRQMLGRYGAAAADERARDSARRLSLGDRY